VASIRVGGREWEEKRATFYFNSEMEWNRWHSNYNYYSPFLGWRKKKEEEDYNIKHFHSARAKGKRYNALLYMKEYGKMVRDLRRGRYEVPFPILF
jgi:hypothetical protein